MAKLPVLSGILVVLYAQPAFGQARTCSPISIEVDAAVSARWPSLPDQLRETFEGRDAIDRCARARVSVRDGSITVEVVLPDGRSATRSVSRRADVAATLEALLLVPQRSAQVEGTALDTSPRPADPYPSSPQTTSPGTRGIPFNEALGAPERDTLAPSSGRRPSRVRIELSAVTGARVGEGQASVGAGALSFLDLSGWLIGFQGRADRYQAVGSGDWSGWAVELAVLGGRRFHVHGVDLDLDLGPGLIPQGTSTLRMQSSNVDASSSSTVPRLLVGGRVSFSPRSIVHTFVGIDGELGPSRLGADERTSTPHLDPGARTWGHRGDAMILRRAPQHGATPRSDPQVLSDLAGGEIGALGELYDRYREPVRRFLARATSDAGDVDDLVHATFLAAARSAERYDGRPSCRPWLIGIAAQLLRRRRRGTSRLREILSSLAWSRTTSVDPRPILHARSDLERALARITEAKRITILMAEVEGLSCPEIAAALGVPIGTVWTRLHAARRELRQALEGGPS